VYTFLTKSLGTSSPLYLAAIKLSSSFSSCMVLIAKAAPPSFQVSFVQPMSPKSLTCFVILSASSCVIDFLAPSSVITSLRPCSSVLGSNPLIFVLAIPLDVILPNILDLLILVL